LTLNATTSLFGRLRFDAGVGASFSTNVPITLTTGTGIVFLETAGTGVVATLNGILSAGTGGALAKTGSGVVSLTASNTYSAITRVGSLTTETAGENVLRVTPTALPSPNIEINAASILEIDNGSAPYTFTRAYGINANNYYVANRVARAGGGFSSRGTGGATVSSNITFGTTTAEAKWIGPMYFGTALGTSQGRVTMSGTLNINATNTSTSAQTFYVFGNPSTEGGCATISNISAPNLTYACVMEKRGTGALRIDNLTYNFSPILNHYEGTFDCTTGISGTAFIDARPAANGVVFRVPVGEPATNFPSISNASNFAFECNASSSSTATVNFWNTGAGAQGIGSATVILSGSTGGVGKVTVTSGTGTGKIIKTGASAWELSYAYANLAAGFSGGVEVQAGLMKASKRYALGGGPITIKGGQLQFSDTSGNTLGTIASLSTAGATSTPRIILGA
jgi:autotransporter-associated beta strand protein